MVWRAIKHSENKIITQSEMSENEIGPGLFQFSVRQKRVLQEYCETFSDLMAVERGTRALQVQPHFRNV